MYREVGSTENCCRVVLRKKGEQKGPERTQKVEEHFAEKEQNEKS